jgi:hypothetical protein
VLDLDSLPDITEDERRAYPTLVTEARACIKAEQRRLIRVHITSATPDRAETAIEREINTLPDWTARGELDTTHPLYLNHGTTCTPGSLYKTQEVPIAQVARCQDTCINGAPYWGWVLRGAVVRPFLAPAFPTLA